ncbi:MAG: ECF transporter S component [Christensenellaceae bacterium]
MKKTTGWKLKDIIMVAILGVVFALIYLAVLYAGIGLTAALTPFGLAPFGFELVYGIWFMAATLAAYIIQKPGVAIVSEFLAACLELLMGNTGGGLVIIAGAVQGAGAEVGFAVFRYKRFDMASMCLSGALAATFSFLWGFVQSGYALLDPALLIAMLLVRIGSAVLFSGVICKFAGSGLAKTGVLKNYALGANMKFAEVADEEE